MSIHKRRFIALAIALSLFSATVQARYLQADPVGYEDDLNLYVYVYNDPLNRTDPTGKAGVPCGGTACDFKPMSGPLNPAQDAVVTAIVGLTPIGTVADVIKGVESGSIAEVAQAVSPTKKLEKLGDAVKAAKETIKAVKRRDGDFTRAQKNEAKRANAERNDGQMACQDCNRDVQSVKSEQRVATPENQAQVHHEPAIKDGGGRDSEAVVLCPECHKDRHR